MAKVTLSPLVEEIHGQVGNLVFRRTRQGGTSLIRKADMSNVQWSPAQAAHRKRFQAAVAYARHVLADETLRKDYEARAASSGKRAFELAVSDYFQRNPK